MKKLTKIMLSAAGLALAMGGVSSCSEDPEFDSTETLTAGEGDFGWKNDIWDQNDINGQFTIEDYGFSHIVTDFTAEGYGLIVKGFTPSKIADNSQHDVLYEFPYASMSGGGVKGPGSSYLVAYWDTEETEETLFADRSCRIVELEGERFQPQSAMVCVNSYLYYDLLNGNDFMTDGFADTDWVTLTAHGVHEDGTVGETTFYLVNTGKSFVTSWTKFDLTALGTCVGVYFTMDSSFKNEYGLIVPTYFCIDNIVVKD